MMLKVIRKRKRNWLDQWLRINCLLKDALEGMMNGRRVRGRRRHQMIDDIKIYGSYAETRRKAENRKDWRMLGMQRKTCPWAEHLSEVCKAKPESGPRETNQGKNVGSIEKTDQNITTNNFFTGYILAGPTPWRRV
ncbi:hypothetical protein ANN_15491 [Periplaneta americana]|uniref:Uncharacterized protein n=1 Tax=Periplaneta americana TaxID=6978 RepID=A0ABQ8SGS7_PERAM|nr:hypothetical protein ANN_15491 [Periplaneta americana]